MDTGFIYTNQLYFTVLEQDTPKFLLLLDLSLYSEELPPTPVYDIIPPGYTNPIRISAKPRAITSVNSGMLFSAFTGDLPNLTDLPDGVYTIIYKVQPYDRFHVKQDYLRTVAVNRGLDAAFISVENSCRHAWYNRWQSDLLEVSIMLATAKALVRSGNSQHGAMVFRDVEMEVARLTGIANNLTV
jgi:hypothetical protein